MTDTEQRRREPFAWLHSRRLDRLQSGIVLPTARSLYLAGAVFCVVAVVLALLVALFFQISSWQRGKERPLPAVLAPPAVAPTFDRIEQRLSGPSSLRFVVDRLDGDVAAGEVLGHFDADAANGLASHPDDFQLVGGPDAELFQTVYQGSSGHTGLAATKALADAVSSANPNPRRLFTIRVVARDTSGNRSAPADLSFSLEKNPQTVPPAETQAEAPVTDLGGEGSLPKIARAVALRVATRGTPEFFDAYKYALAEPSRCEAPSAAAFIDLYRASFIRFRDRVTKDNLDSFYAGICEAWADAVNHTREATAAADDDRQQVAAANAAARMEAQVRAASARMVRNAALGFAFSALLAFMMIALFLAFMAIEGHSAAVRQAIELLAARKEIVDDASKSD